MMANHLNDAFKMFREGTEVTAGLRFGACLARRLRRLWLIVGRTDRNLKLGISQIETDLPFENRNGLFGLLPKRLRVGRLQHALQTLDFSVSFQDHADQNVWVPRQVLATVEHDQALPHNS